MPVEEPPLKRVARDSEMGDQLTVMTQLREKIAALEKQILGKEAQLLGKERQVRFLLKFEISLLNLLPFVESIPSDFPSNHRIKGLNGIKKRGLPECGGNSVPIRSRIKDFF